MLVKVSRISRVESVLPSLIIRLTSVTDHASELLLETSNSGTFQNLQRKSVVDVHHRKNGPIEKVVLSRNFTGMTIKLKTMLSWTQRPENLVMEWKQLLVNRMSLS